MRGSSRRVHCIADCLSCGKRWEGFLTAKEQARAHARATGHHVHGEEGLVFEYKERR